MLLFLSKYLCQSICIETKLSKKNFLIFLFIENINVTFPYCPGLHLDLGQNLSLTQLPGFFFR